MTDLDRIDIRLLELLQADSSLTLGDPRNRGRTVNVGLPSAR